MIPTPGGEVDPSGEANAMYDALGRPFNLACRTNGALTLDRMRKLHGLNAKDYAASEAALAGTPPGSRLRFWHPDAESFPTIAANPNVVRLDSKPDDFTNDYPAIVDSALGLVFRHGCRVGGQCNRSDPISVCGGPSGSHEIMRRVAAIWNRPAIHIGQAGAPLGAAIAAAVALAPESRQELRDEVADSLRRAVYESSTTVTPDPEWVHRYHADGGFLDRLESAFEKMRT
jgi:xylulokinase